MEHAPHGTLKNGSGLIYGERLCQKYCECRCCIIERMQFSGVLFLVVENLTLVGTSIDGAVC